MQKSAIAIGSERGTQDWKPADDAVVDIGWATVSGMRAVSTMDLHDLIQWTKPHNRRRPNVTRPDVSLMHAWLGAERRQRNLLTRQDGTACP